MLKFKSLFKKVMAFYQVFLVMGYVLAGGVFVATTVSAYAILTTPMVEPQVGASTTAAVPLMSAVTSEETTILRDPFVYGAAKPVVEQAADVLDPSGIRVKAIILSLKSGVVLEDALRGAVYFLSEGESAKGIMVKSISKSGVVIEIDGKQVDLKISGGKE